MSDNQPPLTPPPPPPLTPPPPPPSAPPSAHVAWWKRRWLRLPVWAWIAIGVVVLASFGQGGSSNSSTDTSASATSSSSGTDETAPTTDAPTTTKAPSTTAKPTTTLAPTTTLPPQPIEFTGRGDSVVELPDLEAYVATVSHNGSSNFVIWALDTSLEQSDLLVNTIGSYQGRLAINLTEEMSALEINADGDWTISMLPLVNGVQIIGNSLSGVGDDVLFVAETGVYTITHDGDSNFVIWVYGESGRDLAINEIGTYSGNVPLRGPAFVIVSADGNWSISRS